MEKVIKRKDVPARKAEDSASTDEKRGPLQTLVEGDCSASIWAREHVIRGKPRTFLSVTLERSYKDRNGAWRYTRSFDPDSLGRVVSLCQRASEIMQRLAKEEQ